jgi:hypothetical protein
MSRDHPATVEPFQFSPAKAGWFIKGVSEKHSSIPTPSKSLSQGSEMPISKLLT